MEPFEFPAGNYIFIDIETDTACRRVWLIGLLVDGELTQLYADCWGEERAILEGFLGFLDRHRDYTLVSYSGTGFDYRVTLNAARRHGLDTKLMERFPHIDLCTLLRRYFVFPHQGYALKGLGGYLHYGFRQNDLDGLAVALEYQRHIESGAPLDVRVLEYNEDDILRARPIGACRPQVTRGDTREVRGNRRPSMPWSTLSSLWSIFVRRVASPLG